MNLTTWIMLFAAIGTCANAVINFYKKPIDNWWEKRLNRPKPDKTKKRINYFDLLFAYVLPPLIIVYILAFKELKGFTLFTLVANIGFIFLRIKLDAIIKKAKQGRQDSE